MNKKAVFCKAHTQKNSLPSRINFSLLTLFGLMFFVLSTSGVRAANIVVNSATDDGAGTTLRQAIITANSNGVSDTITFSLAAGTVILPTSPLPALTEAATTIDGGATPSIELNGSLAGDPAIGLQISAANCVVRGLIINRFTDSGIRVDTNGSNTTIAGNIIGTNTAGASGIGNFNRGILIVGTTGNIIGGSTTADRNIISGNFGTGISITRSVAGAVVSNGAANVTGNYIGTNTAGTADLGNSQEGIRIVDSAQSVISGNLISGNDSHGISIIQSANTTSAANNLIAGNFIGVDSGGNLPLANDGSGVLLNASGNIIGGNSISARNIISGNAGNGVSISSSFATGNAVQGNFIGVGQNGTTAIGNRENGVQISSLAAGNIIGGSVSGVSETPGSCNGVCNVIANNGDVNSVSAKAGIYIDNTGGVANSVRGNSIYNNGGLGIDLGTVGATTNDAGDPDTGANNLQNFPVLNAANTSGFVGGTLNSTPNTNFAIDFYRNLLTDTSTDSEGRTYIGSVSVTTDSGGNAVINFNAGGSVLSAGQFVTATATATTGATLAPKLKRLTAATIGDTSEISAAQAVIIAAPTASAVSIGGRVIAGRRGIARATVSLTDSKGVMQFAATNSFGYYRFTNVPAGDTYILTVKSKSYKFNAQVVSVTDDLNDLNFTAR